jgi:uncharacterized protein (TIGR00725 family)
MRTVIGVMGSGERLDPELRKHAYRLGAAIAREGWVLLNGGRCTGIMDATAHGAAEADGVVVGVLPDGDLHGASPHLTVAIRTGMGDARNAINALSSDVVIAMQGGAGTLSEVALALKAGKRVIALGLDPGTGFEPWVATGQLERVGTVEAAIEAVRAALAGPGGRS